MIISWWHTLFFDPIYNGLVFFIDVIPGGDVGLAIIAITIIVKIVLLPVSQKAQKTQRAMKVLEPQLKAIQKEHKDNREELARATMAVYKDAGVNPFSSILLLFLQIPIVIALYFAVSSGGGVSLPAINTELLYSFVPKPEVANMMFVGLFDMAGTSVVLALFAGAMQYVQVKVLMPFTPPAEKKEDEKPDFKEELARSMQFQMRYGMPLIIFFVAYTTSAAIALYFVISALTAVAQELALRK